MKNIMQSGFLLISHVARLSFTSQWLKIFSESLVIKVRNSNSKEEQIRIVHHWWATSHGPPMVWSGFVAWNFVFEMLMICASCFRSHLSPCQALAEALEHNSTLTDLNLEENSFSKTFQAWLYTWSSGRPSPNAPLLAAKYFTNRPQTDMASRNGQIRIDFLVWNATNACFWYIFRQGIIARDFKWAMPFLISYMISYM